MTKVAAILIYGKKKPSKISFSGTSGSISTKLVFFCFCFLHRGLLSITCIVCSNDDHEVTLIYFTAKSNFVTGFSIGKGENNGYFRNCCSQWPEN